MRFLLDTHVLVAWALGLPKLNRAQSRAAASAKSDVPLAVADISLWEVATLVERGKLRLDLPLREWLEQVTAPPLVRRLDLSPAVAAELAALAGTYDWDPADRIIVATARIYGLRLVTSDQRISESKLVPVVN
jgi:PIN domain nuclease of toxin-antitoxin system